LDRVLLHRHYERTCKACGYTWVVSRREVLLRPAPINRFEALGETLRAVKVEALEAEAMHDVETGEDSRRESYDETRRCQSCGVDDFTERPIQAPESAEKAKPGDAASS
jgi:predicted nucleic-acid-binding Zn-ribbon protein